MIKAFAAAALLALAAVSPALSDATEPVKDIAGAKDSALLKRYDGSFIVSHERVAFDEFSIPLSKLEKAEPEESDQMNNYVFRPKQKLDLEGARSRIAYVIPPDRSPLEVLRNYEDEIGAAGGEILYRCKAEDCGGTPSRASAGGGGDQSLTMYFFSEAKLKDAPFSNGSCALTSDIDDQRFVAAKLPTPNGEAHVTVQTFTVKNDLYCKAFNARTVALVQVIEPKSREKKMVLVKAEEMAKTIDSTGRIALYGIYFDTDKATLKPESDPTIAEIADLLSSNSKLAVLIVGHTDNQGAFDYNVDLSRRRADAVAKALVAKHKIDVKRTKSAGAGMIAPAAPNDDEAGRSKNRRVEIVKLN